MTQLLQAVILGALISLFGRRKMGMLRWKPFKIEDVAFLRPLLEAGEITPAIDRTYPLSEVAEALRYQAEGRPRGKVAITV